MNYSPFQTAIFDAGTDTGNSLIINAVAGSGKTTTVVELSKRLNGTTSFLAFNKNNATDIAAKGVANASTFHSAAFAVMKLHGGKYKIDPSKSWRLAKIACGSEKDSFEYEQAASKVVGVAKQACFTPDDLALSDVEHILNYHDVDFNGDTYRLAKNCTRLFELMVAEAQPVGTGRPSGTPGFIDFDDMLYMPWLLKMPFLLTPNIILDEAQDTNKLQRELLKTSGARLIAVGDPYQSIYGFRGADADAIHAIGREFTCNELPLSISYRCDSAIIAEAQQIVPHILPREGCGKGQVLNHDSLTSALAPRADEKTTILCRTNAPLIRAFFRLAANNHPVAIIGKDIGKQMAKIVRDVAGRATSYPAMRALLDVWLQAEVSKLKKRGGSEHLALEKHECLMAILDGCEGNNDPVQRVPLIAESIFTDHEVPGAITLSSIHKAKGREWDTVIFYGPELLPLKSAKQEWQLIQERNLEYVAITRAQHTLIYTPLETNK